MYKDLLPIGSVITLKGGSHKIMIIGIKPVMAGDEHKTFDYVGVLYPEGYLGGKTSFVFNHSDIADYIFVGYQNSEWTDFMNYLDEHDHDDADTEEG